MKVPLRSPLGLGLGLGLGLRLGTGPGAGAAHHSMSIRWRDMCTTGGRAAATDGPHVRRTTLSSCSLVPGAAWSLLQKPHLDGQRLWNHRQLWRRRARAPEAVAGCPVGRPLPLGVPHRLEPPGKALRGRGSRAGAQPRLPFDHATAHGWQPDVARVHGRESKRRAERDVRSQRQSQRVRPAAQTLVGAHQQCGTANRERLRATVVA